MDKLKLAFFQQNIIWEDPKANIKRIEQVIDSLEDADLLILPEMFNTGFTMNTHEQAIGMDHEILDWLKNKAVENNMGIAGSVIVRDESKYVNRFLLTLPCATVLQYDKRHLFRMGGEHEKFSQGTSKKIFNYYGWRIRPMICYDLRFPVWSRNQNDYDLLIYVANWPAPRREVWKTLLKARAIENQCYVVGVNRVGTDGMNINYSGDSVVINPRGEVISELPEGEEGVGMVEISLSELNAFKNKFPVYMDADDFTLNNID